MTDGPLIVCSPGHRFGRPRILGVEVSAITERVWAGDSVESVAEDFAGTRDDVLAACWFVARHGEGDGFGLRTRMRNGYKQWAAANDLAIRRGEWASVTDPPKAADITL